MGNMHVFALCFVYVAAVFSERHFSRLLFNEKWIQAERWTFSLCYGWHLPQNAPEEHYKSLAT